MMVNNMDEKELETSLFSSLVSDERRLNLLKIFIQRFIDDDGPDIAQYKKRFAQVLSADDDEIARMLEEKTGM